MTSFKSTDDAVAVLVEHASGGLISVELAMAPGADLQLLGLTSLAFLRLIDGIENEFGVYVDLEEDIEFMRTVSGISRYLTAQAAG